MMKMKVIARILAGIATVPFAALVEQQRWYRIINNKSGMISSERSLESAHDGTS